MPWHHFYMDLWVDVQILYCMFAYLLVFIAILALMNNRLGLLTDMYGVDFWCNWGDILAIVSDFILSCVWFLSQLKRKLPKVNRNLAKKILEMEEVGNDKDAEPADAKKSSKRKKEPIGDLMDDERFKELFTKEVLLPYFVISVIFSLLSGIFCMCYSCCMALLWEVRLFHLLSWAL